MPIPFTCPHCGATIEVEERYASHTGPCAWCGKTISIPALAGKSGPGAGKKRWPAWLVWLLVGFVLAGVVVALMWPVVQLLVAVQRQAGCTANLKQIGLALHRYHAEFDCFPPAYLTDEDGQPMHSWRVLILPHLDEQSLYRQYRFEEPWKSPHNLAVAKQMPSVFRCPEDRQAGAIDTSYAMLVGPGAFSEGPTSTTIDDFTDGTDNTLAVVEVSGFGIRWTQPRDLSTEEMTYTINDAAAFGPTSNHYGCAEFLFADGSVRALGDPRSWEDEITPEMLRALITRAGGDQLTVY